MNKKILIKDGYVITMDGKLGDIADGAVLIEDGQIVKVGKDVDAHGAEVMDARGMIVMPGLIDNHRHMWQGLIRGASANHTFGEYFGFSLEKLSAKFTPEDIYLGNLLCAYEALNDGVTTVLDWSHATNTIDHAKAAVKGLEDAGGRAVFAYGPPSIEWWNPKGQPNPDDVRAVHEHISKKKGLVSMAIAIRGPEFSDMDRVKADIALARELKIRVTMHAGIPGFHDKTPSAKLIDQAGLLGDDITFVHCNAMHEDDFALIAKKGAHVSGSPEVEMQMGFGPSPMGTMLKGGAKPTVSVDVVTAVGGHLLTQLRFMLQTQRMFDNLAAVQASGGKPLESLPVKTKEVLPYVTTNPAESLGMADKIGSLTPGKQADIILVNMNDFNMFLSEPSAALVQSAHPGNVDTVMVAGNIVKRKGKLLASGLDQLREKAAKANARLLASV
jgi:5-methylthioadenosine/S-adenosylhomocysteine deaminase